ncbi:MAG: LCP family protein [Acidimicrobiales bacterium]
MSVPRHARLRTHRTWPQRLLVTVGVLLTTVCVAAAGAVGYVYWKLGKLVHFDDLEVADSPPGEPRNYLIVGSDSRENIDPSDPEYEGFVGDEAPGGKRSDTIMVLRIDPEAATAQLLSFPRDLYLEIAGTGEQNRINSAYGQGRQVLIDTIAQNFGIDVNHYIEVDFKGFEGLVSAIGGVPLYFETAMRDEKSGLFVDNPGCVQLDGAQALAFARSRALEYKNERGRWAIDPTGDLGRITRQQLFMRRALGVAIDQGVTNPITLNRLLDVAVENVGVDANLDTGDLVSLAREFQRFTEDELETYSLPVESFRAEEASVVRINDQAEANRILNIFRGLPPGAVTEADVTVSVRNGTGVDRQAADAIEALEAVGFAPGDTGDTDAPAAATTVYYAPGSEFAADLLTRHLTSDAVLEVDESLDPDSLVLATGPDFTTVMVTPRPPSSTTTTSAPESTTSTTAGEDEDASTGDASTTTTVVGITPGEAPPGVECG